MSKVASGMMTAAGVAAGGAGVVAGPGGGAGAAGVRAKERAARAAPASVIKVRITVPSLTRSPTLTFRSATFPPSGEGTSIEALSDSSVSSGCSAAMVSPGLTMTSMDRHVFEIADVGNADVGDAGRRARRCRWSGHGGFHRFLGRASTVHFEHQDRCPLTNLVADLNGERFDHACGRPRHFHRRLVPFQRD